jgi:hypothetical protein
LVSKRFVCADPLSGENPVTETSTNPPANGKNVETASPSHSTTERFVGPEDNSLCLDKLVRPHIRERILEDVRQSDSMRGIILETINILYREYGIRGLKYFRLRVEAAETTDELKVAADMLTTIGRFHELYGQEEQERQ